MLIAPQGTLELNKNSPQAEGLVACWPIDDNDRYWIRDLVTNDTQRLRANNSELWSGTWSWRRDPWGRRAIDFNGSTLYDEYLSVPNSHVQFNDEFRLSGDLTLHACGLRDADGAGGDYIYTFGANGESTATNFLYSLLITPGTSFQYLNEYGSTGTNSTAVTSSAPANDQWFSVTVRRNSTLETVDFFWAVYDQDGRMIDQKEELDLAITNPTGGTSSFLRIGTSPTASSPFAGMLNDFRIHDVALPRDVCRAMNNPETRWDLYTTAETRRNKVRRRLGSFNRPFTGGAVLRNGFLQ